MVPRHLEQWQYTAVGGNELEKPLMITTDADYGHQVSSSCLGSWKSWMPNGEGEVLVLTEVARIGARRRT